MLVRQFRLRLSEDRKRNLVMREREIEPKKRGATGRGAQARQDPHPAPAFVRLLEKNALAPQREGVRLAQANGTRFAFLDWKRRWIFRAAELPNRAFAATRLMGNADQRAEIHQCGVVIASASRWNESGCSPPKFAATGGRIDRDLQISQASEDPRDVGFDNRRRLIECETGDRARSVLADARQLGDFCEIVRQFAAELFHDDFRSPVQISRTRVIAETLPRVQHRGFIRASERGEVRETR